MASLSTIHGYYTQSYDYLSNKLYTSEWSIFSLPPPSQQQPGYPTCSALFADTFTNSHWLYTFAISFIAWYIIECIGCSLWRQYVPKDQRIKIQKEQFSGHFISMIHSTMIACASTLVATQYTPLQALNATTNFSDDPPIWIYRYCATFSASYFLLDACVIWFYYQQSWDKRLSFVIHHFLSGICMCAVLLAEHPIVAYISALNFLIEWSTVFLNIRILARIWSLKSLYFIGGMGMILTYPATRMGWNLYLILISFNSGYVTTYTCPGAGYILGSAEIFVCGLSTFYYFSVIMVKPYKMYTLKTARDTKSSYK